MTRHQILDKYAYKGSYFVFLDGFDDAILGVINETLIAYSIKTMIEKQMNLHNQGFFDAVDVIRNIVENNKAHFYVDDIF